MSTSFSSPHEYGEQASVWKRLGQFVRTSARGKFHRHDTYEDAVQQVTLELLEKIGADGIEKALENRESPEKAELHRAVWRVLQRDVRLRKKESGFVRDRSILLSTPEPDHRRAVAWDASEKLRKIMKVAGLSDAQRNVIERMSDGSSAPDVAEALGLETQKVTELKYRAILKMRTLTCKDGRL